MWVYVRKTMFCKEAATSELNKVGAIMIKAIVARFGKNGGNILKHPPCQGDPSLILTPGGRPSSAKPRTATGDGKKTLANP